MTPLTPDYTPVTASQVAIGGVWPTHAMDTPTGSGVQSGVVRPILLAETLEPLQLEDSTYMLAEGV